ncbi:MAG: diguanylate cyclase [Negativicutes bacterium]|nr:diguanylate cyclase [Negativicutes bacterium]
MNIGNRLFFWISISLIVTGACLVYLIVPFVQQAVYEKTAVAMASETEKAADKMDCWFSERGQILRSIAAQVEVDGLEVDNPRLPGYLEGMAARFSDKFDYLYIGFANKVHVTTRTTKPLAGFDPTSRLWYQDAMLRNTVVVTEPYPDVQTGKFSLTVAYPVQTAVPGVIGSDLYLSVLEGLTREALFHPQAEVILISRAGIILYSTDSGLGSPGESIAATHSGLYYPSYSRFLTGEGKAFEFERESISYHIQFSRVLTSGWTVAVVLPDSAFSAEAKKVLNYLTVILLFGATVIFLIIYFTIYQITLPLQWISETAQKLGDGRLTESFPRAGAKEVVDLAQSLDKMRRNLLFTMEEKDNLLEETQAQNTEIEALYEQMKQLVQELRAIVDNAVDVIYIRDASGKYLLTNHAAKKLLGKADRTGAGPANSQVMDKLTEKDGEVLAGNTVKMEVSVPVKGETHTYDIIKVPLRSETGVVSAVCVIARDITERKMTEKLQTALYQISETASLADNLEELYRSVHAIINDLILAKNFMIATYDEKNGMLLFSYRVNELEETATKRHLRKGLAEYVIRTGKPLLVTPESRARLEAKGEIIPPERPSTDWLGVPLKSVNNKVFGVMSVWSYTEQVRYTKKDQNILSFVSNQVAMAIERKQAEETSRYLGMHDALTGLYNRAYFEEELNRFNDDRYLPTTIVMCDIDGLKLLNDTFGHALGDQLLIATARLIRRVIRHGDVAARIGGDEFAILLPGTGETVAYTLANRLRTQIEKYNQKAFGVPLSVSFGYAIRLDRETSMQDLLRDADNHMYREKLHHSQSVRSAIVQTVMKLLEERDFVTEEHADRLQDLTSRLAQQLKLSEPRIAEIRLLARFHDIGKVGIPDHILLKPGPLTPEERKEMRRHCEIGYRIAQSSADLMPIADWILKHQEWWNGDGYPLGLKGEDIPLECRILAVADAYDAMTSDRPYRAAMSHEAAVAELVRCAGSQFDPDLIEAFIASLKEAD